MNEINESIIRIRDVKDQVSKLVTRTKDSPDAAKIADKGNGIAKSIDTVDPKLTTKAANGQDIINFRNGINGQYNFLLGYLESNDILTAPGRERFAELEQMWQALQAEVRKIEVDDVNAFNKILQDAKIDGVIVPKPKPKVAM